MRLFLLLTMTMEEWHDQRNPSAPFANLDPTHFVARGARWSCFSETYLSLLKSAVFCGEVLPCLITFTARKLLLIQIRLTLLNSVSLLLDIVTLLSASLKVSCPRGVQLSQSFTDQNTVSDVAGT